MKVSQLLETRRKNWHDLELLCTQMERRNKRKLGAAAIARFAALYRAVCADLALADSYQMPPNTVDYLHRLVGRAHNQLYRSERFKIRSWGRELLVAVPGRLYRDNCVRLAFLLFWGAFASSMYLSSAYSPFPQFADRLLPPELAAQMERDFSNAPMDRDLDQGTFMTGIYVMHNTGIGLRVFAWGLLFGVGGIYETIWNAVFLGAVFGHMTTVPQQEHFFHFVTAHGPFELTAVVMSAAAGMRLGFSMVDVRGYRRQDALRRGGRMAMPAVAAAMILFGLAALIEGNISPSRLSYEVKAAVAVLSSGLLMAYFVLLGRMGAGEESG